MSFLRAKLRATDRNVFYDNKLTNFTNVPMYYDNLAVRKNETIGGTLDVSGNVTIRSDLTLYGNLSASSYYATGNFYLNNYLLIPYGTIIQYAGQTAPGGWALCDGTRVSIYGTYSNLFGAIGYLYGGFDNSFNLPNLCGRVPIGAGSGSGLTTRTLGQTGGEEKHTLTTAEMPSHTHTNNSSNADGGYGLVHINNGNGNNTLTTGDNNAGEPDLYTRPAALTINSTGSDVSHNIMQPYIVVNYLIKY